MIETRLVWG